jgi:hypothetical protein
LRTGGKREAATTTGGRCPRRGRGRLGEASGRGYSQKEGLLYVAFMRVITVYAGAAPGGVEKRGGLDGVVSSPGRPY